MIGYNEQDPHYTYDPKKCEEEFKASTLKGADGKSLWDTGFRMTIAYNTGNTARQTAAQIFQQELSAINPLFVVEVTGLPWPTFLKNQRASNLPIFISGWLEDINDTHNWVVPYTTGTYGGRQKMPADLQKQFGDLASQAVVEVDPAKRAAIYAEVNKLFYDNIPTIFLYQVVGRHYEQRWVQDYFYNPIYSGMVFYNLSKQ
jgi:peptide/nickel transport system substrate-binding protein